jgi:4-carboxymuconolactone decarboxylase
MPRLDRIYPKDMSPEQLDFYNTVRNRPTYSGVPPEQPLVGPSGYYQRSIPFGLLKSEISNYLRQDSKIPPQLRELTILTVTRMWNASYAFCEHERIATREGLDKKVIAALRKGEAPEFENADQAAIHRFVCKAIEEKAVDDETYQAAFDILGEALLVELIGLIGHYVTAAMTLSVFEEPVRDGDEPLAKI